MSDAALARHLGYEPGALETTYPGTTVLNHEWWDPTTFVTLGTISADPIRIELPTLLSNVDGTNPAVREEILNVFRFWFDLGVDGIMTDAPSLLAGLLAQPANERSCH